MKDENTPPKPGDPLPTIIRGLKPEELFARGMQTVKMSSPVGTGAWKPPPVEEMKRLFPGYEVISLLGHGGMGAVYKARQPSLDRLVAIKLLPLDVNRDREFSERFKREAQTMARLHHTNLVTLYNFGQTPEGHLFYVMEYVEGATLHELARSKALTPERVIKILGQVCEGLASAHRDGVVHRDIKPANILVDVNGTAKVADFGLARSTKQNSGQTLTIKGMAVGTPDYMSPEQRRGERVDQRADIYALGVVLYEALTGQLPRGVFPPASEIARTPKKLDDIVGRAMHQDPAKRFQSTMEMKMALEAASSGEAAAPTQASPARPQPGGKAKGDRSAQRAEGKPAKSASGSKGGVWIAIGAIAVVLGILGYVFLRPADPTPQVAQSPLPSPSPLAAATPAPTPATVVATTPAPAPETKPIAFGHSRYQLIRSQASWMQAKTEAEFKGGHLATITTKEEADWVRETFGPELPRKWTRIWIGAYQADHNSPWHWVTDEEFTVTDWMPGEPNSAKNPNSKPPFCASLSNSTDNAGSNGWDDSPPAGGSVVIGYLIEWDEPKPAPSAPVAMATPAPAPAATPAPVAMATPAPTPTMPASSVDEGQQRLTLHKGQFDAAYTRDIAGFDTARDVLRRNYQAAIDREIARAAQTGNFTDASALREERVRASTGMGLDSNPSALPAVLQPLRAGFRTNLAKLESDRAAKLKPIRDGYLRLLDTSHAEFTRVQKLEAALVLKTERDKLAAEWAAETAVAAPETPSPGAPSTAPDATSSWRRVVQLALRFSGRVEIEVEGKRSPVMTDLDMPNRRFEVVKLSFTDAQQNQTLTDADLELVASCRQLEEFQIARAPVTDKGLEVLRGLQALKTLRISYCPQINDQFMPIVASLPELRVLELNHNAITKEGLKHLLRSSKLKQVVLHGDSIAASSVAQLGQLPLEELSLSDLSAPASLDLTGFKQVKRLFLVSMREGKKRLIDEAAKLRGLETLRFTNCDITDDDLVKIGTLSNLKTLELEGSAIKGPGLAHLRSCRSLNSLRLHNCGVTNDALEVIGRDLSALRIVRITGSAQVQAAAFRSLGKCRGLKEIYADGMADDDVAAELAALNGVEVVGLNNSPQLGDAGLQALTRLKSLKRLQVNNCAKLTAANVNVFRKARPDVTVDFPPPKAP